MEDDAPTVGDTIKQETARQSVAFIFSVLGTIAAVYVMKKLQEPDGLKTIRMKYHLERSKAWGWLAAYSVQRRDSAWSEYAKEMYQ